ncbi:tyrosine-type recombinase/integrase [bacterium]|nr:tyrosine-type recombinase/integrase [bacterium]
MDRRKTAPKRNPGKCYDAKAYNRAIHYAAKKAGVSPWNANQLRHLAATNLRREFGIEVARAVLGHSTLATTEIYAERDEAQARLAMERIG